MRITHSLLVALIFAYASPVFSQAPIWTILDESTLVARSTERWIVPEKYTTIGLDVAALQQQLSRVPLRFNELQETTTIELPMPDGSFEQFAIVESPLMHPDLAARFQDIRTFSGQGITNPATAIYLDWTPQGFHAMMMRPGKIYYIDPYFRNDNTVYVSYDREDYHSDKSQQFFCEANETAEIWHVPSADMLLVGNGDRAVVTMKTYDIAIAATGEYTSFHGGATQALAAINTTMNRVRGIYETEAAISFSLVSNNNLLIYTDSLSDPYSKPPTVNENQTNLDLVIGNSNYDIGHVFSTGTGGIAAVGSVCDMAHKAKGVTNSYRPMADAFDVDFVAHEIGHQFGAHHTFNGGVTGSCTAANRYAASAYEPGSGSTIMAYAGLCNSQNLQTRSNAYFHIASLGEIVTFVTSGLGNTCPTTTTSTNNTPTVNADPNGMDGKYIPISTPFELVATGSDPDSDPLTYAWEQLDLGPQGAPSSSSTTAPIFRTFSPSANGKRMFPSLSDILDNTNSIGEKLPTVTRDLNFGCTVRDNQTDGGGYHADGILLHVTNAAGPFAITSHNTSAVLNGDITLTWNVAGTTSAPVSCANVDIQLSLDGGMTFTNLVANTPNDGSQTVTLPNTATSIARLKIKCSDNVFFDINNADLRIAPSGSTCIETITNGNMENWIGWTETSTQGQAPFIANWGIPGHSGTGLAWLGYVNNETARMSQTVSIPGDAHFANLEFWYRYDRMDCGGDVFNVKVNGAVVKSYNMCNDPGASDWTRQIVNLSAHIGTSPTIMFEFITNSIHPSDLFLDDVSVFVCAGSSFAPLPVELFAFDARAIGHDAQLSWATASELNNKGFEVEMQEGAADFQTVGFVPGKGTTDQTNHYEYTVPNLKAGDYYFRLRQMDEDGGLSYSPVRHVLIGGDVRVVVQPNPANEVTHFMLTLEKESLVRLEILDGMGRVVGTVANDQYSSGKFDFAYDLSSLPSGVYHYRLNAGNKTETGRFSVVK